MKKKAHILKTKKKKKKQKEKSENKINKTEKIIQYILREHSLQVVLERPKVTIKIIIDDKTIREAVCILRRLSCYYNGRNYQVLIYESTH